MKTLDENPLERRPLSLSMSENDLHKQWLKTTKETMDELYKDLEECGQSPKQILSRITQELTSLFDNDKLLGILVEFLGLKPTLSRAQEFKIDTFLLT